MACAIPSARTSTPRPANFGSPTTRSTAWAMMSRQARSTMSRRLGQHFGFPWFGGGKVRTVEYKDSDPPKDVIQPEVEQIAHAADLGMDVLLRHHVPGEISQRDILGAARLVEPNPAGGARACCSLPSIRTARPARASHLPKAGCSRPANIPVGRWMWRSFLTARCLCRTIWRVLSIAYPTAIGRNEGILRKFPEGLEIPPGSVMIKALAGAFAF